MSSSFSGPGLRARARTSALTSVLVLSLTLSALMSCSAGRVNDKSSASSQPDITASHVGVTAPVKSLHTTSALGRLVGRLPGPRRQAVRRHVTHVIDRWWEAAYLSADPASRAATFPGFTPGARDRAVADRELMTNAGLLGASLTPLMRKVRLDLLAINKRARSVTARFDLRFRVAATADHPDARRVQVRGRLFLTPGPRGWQIFGYDVSKGWL